MNSIQNLLLVTYDCARADAAYGGHVPTLRDLRSRGVTCKHAVSSAPLTPVSHATVFTGRQPYRHGLRHLFREPIAPGTTTLAQHLLRAGLETGAVVACPGMNRWYGFQEGFLHFDDELPPLPDGGDALRTVDVQVRGLAMKRANVVADRGLEWLEQREPDERWFLFLHFFDAHWPYEPPPIEPPLDMNPYEGELRFADHHLGRVVERLRAGGQLDDTLIVVFGDHGEDLEGWYRNDKGGASLGHPEEKGHGCLLYEQTQHVPLVFSHPSLPVIELETTVGLVDVAPTVTSLLGLDPMAGVDGRDLGPLFRDDAPPEGGYVYAETLYPGELRENTGEFPSIVDLQALWMDGYKVIRPYGDDARAKVFRLSEDPCEENPLPLTALPSTLRPVWRS